MLFIFIFTSLILFQWIFATPQTTEGRGTFQTAKGRKRIWLIFFPSGSGSCSHIWRPVLRIRFRLRPLINIFNIYIVIVVNNFLGNQKKISWHFFCFRSDQDMQAKPVISSVADPFHFEISFWKIRIKMKRSHNTRNNGLTYRQYC